MIQSAATDAKQRPGFQTQESRKGISEIEGKVAMVAMSELGNERVSTQEKIQW
jgi:hypothetical protein